MLKQINTCSVKFLFCESPTELSLCIITPALIILLTSTNPLKKLPKILYMIADKLVDKVKTK